MTNTNINVEIVIESLAAGGDGVGRIDGKACFVPYSVPGDRVLALVLRDGKKSMRAKIVKVLGESAHRREPVCPLFGKCGGCQWMHVEYAVQLEAKRQIVERAVGVAPVEMRPSALDTGYRRLARLHWAPGEARGDGWSLGFVGVGGKNVLQVNRCPVLVSALDGCLEPLASALASVANRVEVRLSAGGDQVVCQVDSPDALSSEAYEQLRSLVPSPLDGIVLNVDGIRGEVGRGGVIVPGPGGMELFVPGGGFGQANEAVNSDLVSTVGRWVKELGQQHALELFAGTGNLSVAIAPHVSKLITAELDARACSAARKNLSSVGGATVTVNEGEALEVYLRHRRRAQLVVLDPPRTGHRDLCREMAKGDHAAIIYVSCDPATLSRDLAILEDGGYKPTRVCGFDMFPQTSHVETAVLLARE